MIRKLFIITALAVTAITVHAQNTLKATITEHGSGEPLIGVTAKVAGTDIAAVSGGDGAMIITGIPDGRQTVTFSYIGYEDRVEEYSFPEQNGESVTVEMSEDEEELGEVVVQTTRGTRTIERVPTRIEFISGEELDEEMTALLTSAMKDVMENERQTD